MMSLILLFAANSVFASVETTLMCMESGQTAPVILAKYRQAATPSEPSAVVITKYFADETTESEVLKGVPPDLSFTPVKTNEGEKLLLITSIKNSAQGVSVRVLSCIYP
ncbi:MAG TPA: hypothetical protein PL182_12780 [Pseudobdellovibrionaceae bacterium]|nr:hypothetical protein [Pseudobdellovibrionaceae bacterium]